MADDSAKVIGRYNWEEREVGGALSNGVTL